MKCDYCKKRLRHPKIVHSAAGAFHGECLDKLHATANALGPVIHAFMGFQQPGGPERVTKALMQGAGPIADFLKDIRERQQKEKTDDSKS